MRRAIAIALLVAAAPVSAQTRRTPPRKTPPPPVSQTVAPDMICPTPLGVGVKTKTAFCEVMAGRDPAGGVLIQIPPHKGPAMLSLDLHNLHLYSASHRSVPSFVRIQLVFFLLGALGTGAIALFAALTALGLRDKGDQEPEPIAPEAS